MPRIKFGIELPQHLGFPYVKDMALAAERLGYDSVWIRDHLIISPEAIEGFPQAYIENGERKSSGDYLSCLPGLAALAAVTSRITLGPDIFALPRRHPVDVANEVATIDQISGGRFIFQAAIGAPGRDWDPLGDTSSLKERGEMLEEGLTIMKLLWTHDEPITFHGKHYTVDNARIGTRPVQKPHPPIWLGVGKTFKRVAKYASGFTLTASMFGGTVREFQSGLEKINHEAMRLGRDPNEIEAAARFGLVIGESDRAAKRRARDHWAKLWGKEEPWFTRWAGSADTIAKVISPYIEAGATHILLWPIPYAGAEALQDIQRFAEEVIPRFKK